MACFELVLIGVSKIRKTRVSTSLTRAELCLKVTVTMKLHSTQLPFF
jgi:hypothetical protein